MSVSRKPLQKRKAFEMLKNEVSQKQISTELKVTEKTAGKWAKEYRTKLESSNTEKKLLEKIELLNQKVKELKALLKNRNSL